MSCHIKVKISKAHRRPRSSYSHLLTAGSPLPAISYPKLPTSKTSLLCGFACFAHRFASIEPDLKLEINKFISRMRMLIWENKRTSPFDGLLTNLLVPCIKRYVLFLAWLCVCLQASVGARRGRQVSLNLEIQAAVSCPTCCVNWELNPGPQQELQAFSISGLSFHPLPVWVFSTALVKAVTGLDFVHLETAF